MTVSSDNSVRLWDVESGLLTGSFGGGSKLVAWDVADDARAVITVRLTASKPIELRTWTFDRAAADRRFAAHLPAARRRLQVDPLDAAALQTVGEWNAFRGMNDTAVALLEQARERSPSGPAIPLARCYWQLNRPAEAARDFQRALDRKEAPEEYLRLCLKAVNGMRDATTGG